MKTFKNQARQGDVFLVKIDALPDGLVEIPREGGRVVCAHGEVTGHAHAISEKHVRQFRDARVDVSDGATRLRAGGGLPAVTYLEVKEACTLRHEEHTAITLEPNVYEVRRQREYHRGSIRRVND